MSPRPSSILTYHSIDTSGSVISVSPQAFREQMASLADNGIPVTSLERVRETPGSVAVTFDDGFRNVFDHAVPILQQYGFPATVFAVSGFCGGRNDWPSQPRNTGVPILELMSWRELSEISKAGITVGCHTATHPWLSRLTDEQLEEELRVSQRAIQDETGVAANTFAYPYGDVSPRVRDAVAHRFRLACGTTLGFLAPDSPVLDLPRLDIYYLRSRFWFRGLGKSHTTAYLATRGLLRSLRQRVRGAA